MVLLTLRFCSRGRTQSARVAVCTVLPASLATSRRWVLRRSTRRRRHLGRWLGNSEYNIAATGSGFQVTGSLSTAPHRATPSPDPWKRLKKSTFYADPAEVVRIQRRKGADACVVERSSIHTGREPARKRRRRGQQDRSRRRAVRRNGSEEGGRGNGRRWIEGFSSQIDSYRK